MTGRRIPAIAAIMVATLPAGMASAGCGAIRASAHLETCGAETCLVVSGHRSDGAATVSIAGHDVAARGSRNWHVALPLATIRTWSAPFARSILVTVAGPDGGQAQAPLPIGLLGRTTELAFLDVSARR